MPKFRKKPVVIEAMQFTDDYGFVVNSGCPDHDGENE